MFSESKTKKFEAEEKMWEGKGIVENLFHLLWTKDPVFGTIPSLSIPDTIIYKYDEPIFWYFMNENMIKKRNKEKLNNKCIETSFLKRVPECGVVAQYFYKVDEKDNNKDNNKDYKDNKENNEDKDENTKVIFEYFNVEEFKKFISNKNKPNNGNGVLQMFLQPKGDYNFIIKTTWGPNLCLFEKKECIKKIGDLKYDLYERVFTYEAEDYHSKTVPLRGYILPNKIEKLSYIIVQHVSNVSFERLQIERMVLNFKVDANNKIWLLYCSFLQLKNTSPFYKLTQMISKIIYDFDVEEGVPKNINTQISSIIKPMSLRKSYYCYNCSQNIDSHRILEVSYKTIIDSYEFDHQERSKINLDEENKKRLFDVTNPMLSPTEFHFINYFSKNITIPPILKRINPKLKEKEYILSKKDPNFLHKVTSVCEECFLIIAKGNVAGGDYNIQRVQTNESTKLFGTGRLRPEVLKYRTKLTIRNIKYKTLIEDLRPDIKPQIINHLISPTRIFSSDKLFDIESDNNINLKPTNHDLGLNLYENIIDLPIRGSIRGSIRFNQNFKDCQKKCEPEHLFPNLPADRDEVIKRKLENVKENENLEFQSSENEEDDDYSSKDGENDRNLKKNLKIKLSPCNLESSNEKTSKNENNSNTIINKEINDNTNDYDIQQKTEIINENTNNDKNSQNNSQTDRDSKYLNSSQNLRKIFIPNLKNTTNSFSRLFMPVNLIPSKQISKLMVKDANTFTKKKNLHICEESTKTHINTIHSRNASLPSLNTPPFQEILTKNNENDMKRTFIYSPRDLLNIPKNAYINKIFDEKSKINPGLKKLKETLDLNCYISKNRKKLY